MTTDLAILRRSRLFEKARDRWIKHHGRVDAFMAAHAGPKDAAFQQRADRLQREARAWARFHRHRTHEVRREARSVALARAFLAGKDYTDVESPYTRTRPDWNRVAELLMYRHMDQDFKRRWDEWRDAADRYLLAQHRIDPYTFPEGIRRHHNIVMGVDAMSGELVHG